MGEKLGILGRLERGVVLAAEGYVFEMERRGYVQAGAYVPEVVLDHPEAVLQLHREFMWAGSEVVLALTYYAHRSKLEAIGRGGELEALNRQAVQLAKQVADEGDALVAGNISNTWVFDPKDPEGSGKLVRAMYEEQVRWAVEEGVDFVVAETLGSVGEGIIGLEVIKEFGLPAMIALGSVHDKTKDGYSFADGCKMLEDHGADIVGMNCSRGPKTLLPIVQEVRYAVDGYVAALPVAYRTTVDQPTFQSLRDGEGRAFPIALDPFTVTRFEMEDFTIKAKEMGVNYIGICCGAAPHHVRAMAEALGREVPASRYSADMSLHPALGTQKSETEEPFLEDWLDL
jgi:betaine-homocysteine S-methyltransferase